MVLQCHLNCTLISQKFINFFRSIELWRSQTKHSLSAIPLDLHATAGFLSLNYRITQSMCQNLDLLLSLTTFQYSLFFLSKFFYLAESIGSINLKFATASVDFA